MDPFSNLEDPDGPNDYCLWLRLCQTHLEAGRFGAVHCHKIFVELHLWITVQNINITTGSPFFSFATRTESKNRVFRLRPLLHVTSTIFYNFSWALAMELWRERHRCKHLICRGDTRSLRGINVMQRLNGSVKMSEESQPYLTSCP